MNCRRSEIRFRFDELAITGPSRSLSRDVTGFRTDCRQTAPYSPEPRTGHRPNPTAAPHASSVDGTLHTLWLPPKVAAFPCNGCQHNFALGQPGKTTRLSCGTGNPYLYLCSASPHLGAMYMTWVSTMRRRWPCGNVAYANVIPSRLRDCGSQPSLKSRRSGSLKA
jgi:hypothetical protein